MRAMLMLADGTEFDDLDHTFTTGTVSAASLRNLLATTTPGATPQSGVELLDLIPGSASSVAVADLGGNILWTYNPPIPGGAIPNPVKMLPNGHFLINFSVVPGDSNSLLQEVDLTGQVIWQFSGAQLNAALATATCAGCNITVAGMHHDFAVLPNGHLIVIAATEKSVSGLTGFPAPPPWTEMYSLIWTKITDRCGCGRLLTTWM